MSNVNVGIINWRATGSTVPVPQYKVDVTLEWLDVEGNPHSWEGTPTFPNDLQGVPAAQLKDMLTELMLRVARKKLGVGD